MEVQLVISILSLIATIVIGVLQIKIFNNQKTIVSKFEKNDTVINQAVIDNKINGIVGNSNNGNINGNKL